jgi:hypothetical protein
MRVLAEQIRLKFLAAYRGDTQAAGPMNDVAVGQDKAVRSEHEAGGASTLCACCGRAPGVDCDHRRRCGFGDAGDGA